MDRSPLLLRALWPVTIAYWLLLFTATHVPGPAMPKVPVNDKIEHLVAYGILGLLLYTSMSMRGKRTRIDTGIIVIAIGLAYGAIDEWLQAIPFVHRDCEFSDWTADAAGIAMAVVLASFVKTWMSTRPDMGEPPASR